MESGREGVSRQGRKHASKQTRLARWGLRMQRNGRRILEKRPYTQFGMWMQKQFQKHIVLEMLDVLFALVMPHRRNYHCCACAVLCCAVRCCSLKWSSGSYLHVSFQFQFSIATRIATFLNLNLSFSKFTKFSLCSKNIYKIFTMHVVESDVKYYTNFDSL